jgi:hypothetical protein
MNTDLSVPDLVSKVKGIFVICFLLLDILFALVQLLPFMGTTKFLILYLVLYLCTVLLYFTVSLRDPGYNEQESGHHLVSLLKSEYSNINMMDYANSKIKKITTKYCFTCNIKKSNTI